MCFHACRRKAHTHTRTHTLHGLCSTLKYSTNAFLFYRYVKFWRSEEDLAWMLAEMIALPGCMSEQCIV